MRRLGNIVTFASSKAAVPPLVLVLVVLCVIWGSVWFHLNQEWDRVAADAIDDASVRAHSLEGVARGVLDTVDRMLLSAREVFTQGQRGMMASPAWTVPYAGADPVSLTVTDARGQPILIFGDPLPGNVIAYGCPASDAARDQLIVDRPYFPELNTAQGGGNTPQGEAAQPILLFSRPVLSARGACSGVVWAAVRADLFNRAARDVRTEDNIQLLVGHDGIVRASEPFTQLVGQPLPDALSPAMSGDMTGSFHSDGTASGEGPSTIAFGRLRDFPLLAIATSSDAEMFRIYRHDRIEYTVGGAVATCLTLAAGILFHILRLRMVRAQTALAAALDNMSQGLIMVDERRRTPVVNRRFSELLGLPEGLARPNGSFDAILDWQAAFGDLLVPGRADPVAYITARNSGLDLAVPVYERTRQDGTEIEIRTALLPNGSAVRTYTDITERKRTERALAAARDAAEAAGRARSEFLAVMSHEIRTPLNGIMGMAGLLLDMDLPAEYRDYLQVIRNSSDHLLGLVNDILDFSRLEAGRLEIEEITFELPATIEGAVHLLSGQAKASGLQLSCELAPELPKWLIGDPGRLRQILFNLVGNAVKFTERGEVRVAASLVALTADSARIAVTVADTGIGISPEACERLFQAFSQVDNSISRRFGGSGLGLAICRRLAEQMGGCIGVESTPGVGSTFRFELVLQPSSAPREANAATASDRPHRRLRVLVTEDNATNRLVATRMLEKMDHRVDAVADGREALRALRAIPYDLVLMDVMMPEMDGLTATRLIRKNEAVGVHTPIIGLTANTRAADEKACRDAGMDGFVTKPVTAERLSAAIEAATACLAAEADPQVPGATASAASSVAASASPLAPTVSAGPTSMSQPAPAASTSPTSPVAHEPVLDKLFLVELAAGIGLESTIDAIGIFREDAPERVTVLRATLGSDPAKLRREAHALAGAARNVGLGRLGAAASALQLAVEEDGVDEIAVDRIASLLDESLAELAEWERNAAALS